MGADRPRRLPSHRVRNQGARLAALSLLFAVGAALGAEPREWLERMNNALTTRNYIGVFTHNQAGRVETLRIIHRVRGHDVSERLQSLDGPGREFIREGNQLTCYFPDSRTVLVEQLAPDGPLLGALPPIGASDSLVYEIRGGERERLLGRNTRVVALEPRDEYRYGYRLWIDEQTSMPLKTQLCGASGEVLEQIVFSNIDLPERIPDSMFKPQVDAANYQWQRAVRQLASTDTEIPMMWDAMKLPPGFRMSNRSAQSLPGSNQRVDHYVYTDGIASVSVFVERQNSGVQPAEGAARVGASSVFSTVSDGHQVTVVGEVPPNTVEFIGRQFKATSKEASAAQGLSLAPPPHRK